MRRWECVLAASLMIMGANAGVARADFIKNGTFSDSPPLKYWDNGFGGAPTAAGGVAIFTENLDPDAPSQIQLEQTFTLPSGATQISFEYRLTAVAGGVNAGVGADSFQATLWDTLGGSFAPTDPESFPAYFSIDRPGTTVFLDPTYVSLTSLADNWTRVTLDVSSLNSQNPQKRVLEFILNGSVDGYLTTAELRNVQGAVALTAVPTPSALALVGCAAPCLFAGALLRRVARRKSRALQTAC